ncbi:MAG: SPOR domain-containing protein [Frankiaceae bacterium]
MILTGAALGEVDRDRAPAVHHPAAPKTPFWTAIVDSEPESSASHPEASAFVAVLKRQGYVTLPVFRSAAYPSLTPGYWVVAVGRFPTSTQAAAAATRLHARGFSKAYPRCVGSAAACSGHPQAP